MHMDISLSLSLSLPTSLPPAVRFVALLDQFTRCLKGKIKTLCYP